MYEENVEIQNCIINLYCFQNFTHVTCNSKLIYEKTIQQLIMHES